MDETVEFLTLNVNALKENYSFKSISTYMILLLNNKNNLSVSNFKLILKLNW